MRSFARTDSILAPVKTDLASAGRLLNSKTGRQTMPLTAFLFPGQGSQAPGMGHELAERYPAARAVFDQADEALGFSLSQLCFEGPAEELRLTRNTQPAILTVSVATLAVLREKGVRAHYVAGHSLGEYSALVAAGSIAFADAVRLVRRRGACMQEAVPEGVGAMAALIGINVAAVQAVCESVAQGQVVGPANVNSANQIVIAGHAEAVGRAVEAAKTSGARRAVMLEVSAPFHCALMAPAREAMEPYLDATDFQDLEIPLVNNWRAEEIVTGADARQGLKQQIPNPVQWSSTIQQLASRQVGRFIEVGPGRVLTGLLRSIDRSLRGSSTHDLASVEAIQP